jgi:hypothetical protein
MRLPVLGIDLGKTCFHLVGLDSTGRAVIRKRCSRPLRKKKSPPSGSSEGGPRRVPVDYAVTAACSHARPTPPAIFCGNNNTTYRRARGS